MKIKIGIIFGGFSKEREISFAGGRTVYDNLNKSLFEAVPVFVDSFGNFVLLNWEFVYKGSIRDFYPPAEFIPTADGDFQIYAEQIGKLTEAQQLEMIGKIGKKIEAGDLKNQFDFAFLCLHGPFGEDGKIQGLLEYMGIPYSGSGILPSAIGIDKSIQKQLMVNAGFNSPKFMTVERAAYINGTYGNQLFEKAKKEIGFPLVIKPANQGSSIGVSILHEDDHFKFMEAIEKALFTKWMDAGEWKKLTAAEKNSFIRTLADIREGIGMPLQVQSSKVKVDVYHPTDLIKYLDTLFETEKEGAILAALDGESKVLIEGFIEGKEFSCIVAQDEHGKPIALPPTEIRKGKELFDYRSKYLPGLSRKITPIDLPNEQIQAIRSECERLFHALSFDVYARIDGFLSTNGKIFLNDPNTTSGMMPSSFFFHQAAEIGLNPSQFLTYIIRTSLAQRIIASKNSGAFDALLEKLDAAIKLDKNAATTKIKVAVILGGYSSERHISVESGRNIYEKLASSAKYEPIPVFLTGNSDEHILYQIPVNILLKDNADDIKDKIDHYKIHEMVQQIIAECSEITTKYSSTDSLAKPKRLTYDELAKMVDAVFIALHGRPGEDGAVQAQLEKVGLPYNGSGVDSSQITIDKYRTNEILKENGFLVAEHLLVTEEEWNADKNKILAAINQKITYPFIAKPVDDGCSSAVRKVKTAAEFEAFAKLIFRKQEALDQVAADLLHIKDKEEFPQKRVILVEELISKRDAKHFLEITGGMLTNYDTNGNVAYEVFEASEALSEGEVLSLEEKFLAGQGQNITPARYSKDPVERQQISDKIKQTLGAAAKVLNVNGYCRIDAFVRIYDVSRVEVVFIEVNSLPGMTPATCIFHQTAINGYKPYDFIDRILEFGFAKQKREFKVQS
ncbi:MAG: D-alanine--D-alanine ligase [Bacteroidetes bacterium]|nr:D-alanine--D-alanine ligase [Bacteroidota bacterium]